MVFSSFSFVFYFLPISIILYFSCNSKFQNFLLLAVSLLFYAYGESYHVFYLIGLVYINYIFAFQLRNWNQAYLLALILIFNLAPLVYFKYFGFLLEIYSSLTVSNLETVRVILPLGISFFTFQLISYQVDVYRGIIRPQKDFLKLLLYISFFPQLIAGPIVRYLDIERFLRTRKVIYSDWITGISRFIIGLSKKLIIANPLGNVCDEIFKFPSSHLSTPLTWIAMIAFSFQIYYDFSGYSDMAIGIGRIFGFKFNENFNFPYSATSFKEFWKRWHISLSSWFKDYVYIPLGGNRSGSFRNTLNLIAVFLLTGIWHGASYNFIAWGMFHGFFLLLERNFEMKFIEKIPKIFRILSMFLLITLSWVFFRIDGFKEALNIFQLMLTFKNVEFKLIPDFYLDNYHLIILVFAIFFSFKWDLKIFDSEKEFPFGNGWFSTTLNMIVLMLLFSISLMSLASMDYNPFIYYRF